MKKINGFTLAGADARQKNKRHAEFISASQSTLHEIPNQVRDDVKTVVRRGFTLADADAVLPHGTKKRNMSFRGADVNPYGDGLASKRIVKAIIEYCS